MEQNKMLNFSLVVTKRDWVRNKCILKMKLESGMVKT